VPSASETSSSLGWIGLVGARHKQHGTSPPLPPPTQALLGPVTRLVAVLRRGFAVADAAAAQVEAGVVAQLRTRERRIARERALMLRALERSDAEAAEEKAKAEAAAAAAASAAEAAALAGGGSGALKSPGGANSRPGAAAAPAAAAAVKSGTVATAAAAAVKGKVGVAAHPSASSNRPGSAQAPHVLDGSGSTIAVAQQQQQQQQQQQPGDATVPAPAAIPPRDISAVLSAVRLNPVQVRASLGDVPLQL
jgi:hypothetical protein